MKDRSLLDSDQEHQDKSLLGGQNPSGFSKELQELINAVAEEVVLQGTSFDSQNTLLKRTAEAEGVDYGNLEKSLKDFFKAMGDYESKGDDAFMGKAASFSTDCGFSEDFIDKLIVALDHKRAEAQSLAEKEALKKEKERLAEETAKQEVARKAAEEEKKKLEAKLKKTEEKAKADALAAEEALKKEKAKLASEKAVRERQQRNRKRFLVLVVVLLLLAVGILLLVRSCGGSKEQVEEPVVAPPVETPVVETPVTEQPTIESPIAVEETKQEKPKKAETSNSKPASTQSSQNNASIKWNGAATYSGPSQGGQPNGIGGTLTFTRDYQLDMKDGRGTMLEIKAGETIENTKFDNGKLRQGELHRKDGTRKWFSI